MKAKVYLFWSPTCSHCPPAKEMINELKKKRDDFDLIMLEPGTAQARDKFIEFDISGTPTFIIQGPGYPENIGLRGNQGEKVMNKYIDIALGKREIEEKKGFFSKIFG